MLCLGVMAGVAWWLFVLLSGCAAVGLSTKVATPDDYATLRNDPTFAPAWANVSAQPWIVKSLTTIKRLDDERDGLRPTP